MAIHLVGAARPGAFDTARGMRVMYRILAASLAREGEPLPPLPLLDDPR